MLHGRGAARLENSLRPDNNAASDNNLHTPRLGLQQFGSCWCAAGPVANRKMSTRSVHHCNAATNTACRQHWPAGWAKGPLVLRQQSPTATKKGHASGCCLSNSNRTRPLTANSPQRWRKQLQRNGACGPHPPQQPEQQAASVARVFRPQPPCQLHRSSLAPCPSCTWT